MADMMERYIESTRTFYPGQGVPHGQELNGLNGLTGMGTNYQGFGMSNGYAAPIWSKTSFSCWFCSR